MKRVDGAFAGTDLDETVQHGAGRDVGRGPGCGEQVIAQRSTARPSTSTLVPQDRQMR